MEDCANPADVWWEAAPTWGYGHLDRPMLVRKGSGHWTRRTWRPEDGALTGIDTGPTRSGSGGRDVTGGIQNLDFAFDGLGNLVSRAIAVPAMNGMPAIARIETFGCDILDRLTTRNGSVIATYAANGNILTKADVTGATSAAYAYSATRPHAVTSAWGHAIDYDATGNMTTRSKTTTVAGVTTDETWAARYAGFDKPRWMANHYDHIGSIEAVTNFGSTATALAVDDAGKPSRFSDDPWGERRDPLTWTGKPSPAQVDNGGPDGRTPRGFTGHEMLDDLGPQRGQTLRSDIGLSRPSGWGRGNLVGAEGTRPVARPFGLVLLTSAATRAAKAPKKHEGLGTVGPAWSVVESSGRAETGLR
jgi:hypothetical protein